MKKVVCIVDNHIYLQYGKVYNVIGELGGSYMVQTESDKMVDIYNWDKKLFVSLEEFRNQKIEQILT
jgi:ribosomal protein L21E